MKTTLISIDLDKNTEERLKRLATAKKRPLQTLVIQAIEEYLQREKTHDLEKQEDLQRWQRYQDTGEHLSQKEIKFLLRR